MRRFGDILLGLGLVVGIGAIVGYQLDIIPTLPPAVLKLVLYKLIFVGGVGLLIAGAFVRRLATRIESTDVPGTSSGMSEHEDDVRSALPPPSASDVLGRKPAIRDKPPSTL